MSRKRGIRLSEQLKLQAGKSSEEDRQMPSVRLNGVRKQFGNVVAIDDVSIEFRDGELTSVLGPSGCGKTTTLNMIAGFTDPDDGSIHFSDQLVADAHGFSVPPHKRNL